MRSWRVAVAIAISALIGLCMPAGFAVASGAPDQAQPTAPTLEFQGGRGVVRLARWASDEAVGRAWRRRGRCPP